MPGAPQVESVNVSCNYYTVLETHQGSIIVTEILEDGEVSWIQNPNNLEDRNSLAKLLFQVDCKEGILVKHIMEMQQTGSRPRYFFHVWFSCKTLIGHCERPRDMLRKSRA